MSCLSVSKAENLNILCYLQLSDRPNTVPSSQAQGRHYCLFNPTISGALSITLSVFLGKNQTPSQFLILTEKLAQTHIPYIEI